MPLLRATLTVAMFGGAAAMLTPAAERLREFASWFARPARLPFAWQAVAAANSDGDASEAFARGQQILDLVPGWTLGHAAFAYRYALTQDTRGRPEEVARQAYRRLIVALAWLEAARADAGEREAELLHSAAFLAPMACRQFPGLDAMLPVGGAAAMTDRFFKEAERLFPGPVTREQRLFHVPTLAGALLDAGQRRQAIELLQTALERAPEARDAALAREWADRVAEVVRALRDEPVDAEPVLADPRFEPLWRHVR